MTKNTQLTARSQPQGQKRAFAMRDMRTLEKHLFEDQNWHDLSLLTVGFDSMLRAVDLLALQVNDVLSPRGFIRAELLIRQEKTGVNVHPVLTPATRAYLHQWITQSGKTRMDFLFTRGKPADAPPISRSHYANLVKSWARQLGYEVGPFSTHSLRRTKAIYLHRERDVPIELITLMLGHRDPASTIHYLGLTQDAAHQACLDGHCQRAISAQASSNHLFTYPRKNRDKFDKKPVLAT